jgi:hypothetical protein
MTSSHVINWGKNMAYFKGSSHDKLAWLDNFE